MNETSERIEQRTEAWKSVRLGKLTASVADKVFEYKRHQSTDRKTKVVTETWTWDSKRGSETYKALVMDTAMERITGIKRNSSFETLAMRWGTEHEAEAREEYVKETLTAVEEVGFIDSASLEWTGCSPDGIIDDGDGLIEIKNPFNLSKHLERIVNDVPPFEYRSQMMLQMLVTGASYVDYVDYDCRYPEESRLFISRFQPTKEERDTCFAYCKQFVDDVQAVVDAYEKLINR